ncbi:MAG: acylphosphatase [Patescibacteria group bacterium]|nr:acylphosphatase [Patescibacteria group bacterium]MBU2509019.1 acylphosphatase [Patescibacteria group bacterium]
MIKHLILKLHGRVQDVFFRESAKQKADELGLVGSVSNDADDTVLIQAQGEERALQKFTAWCKQGPEHAQVTDVDVREGEMRNYSGFKVEY